MYHSYLQFRGLVLSSGQKLTLGLLATITLLADIDMLLLLISYQKLHQARYMTPNKRA
jgi:hypothetical protein